MTGLVVGGVYDRVVRQVAHWLAPEGAVDALGCQRQDYEQELRLVAWQAQAIFRRRKACNADYERKYVCRAVWNHARSRLRTRGRLAAFSENFSADSAGWAVFESVVECYRQHEAREWVRRFFEGASPAEIALAMRLFSVGGNIPRAHDPNEGTLRNFRRTVDRLRRVAESFR